MDEALSGFDPLMRHVGRRAQLDLLDGVARGAYRLEPFNAADVARYADPEVGLAQARMTEGLIEARPDVMTGKPVIAGTRNTVELILEKLAGAEDRVSLTSEADFGEPACRPRRSTIASSCSKWRRASAQCRGNASPG